MKLEVTKVQNGKLPSMSLPRQRSKRYQKFNASIGHIKGASIHVTLLDYLPVYSSYEGANNQSKIVSNHLGKRFIAVKHRGTGWGICSFTQWVPETELLDKVEKKLNIEIKQLMDEKEAQMTQTQKKTIEEDQDGEIIIESEITENDIEEGQNQDLAELNENDKQNEDRKF